MGNHPKNSGKMAGIQFLIFFYLQVDVCTCKCMRRKDKLERKIKDIIISRLMEILYLDSQGNSNKSNFHVGFILIGHVESRETRHSNKDKVL